MAPCCSYPHGQMSMIALVLSIVTWVLGINATWGCRYIQVDGYIVPPAFFNNPEVFGRRGVGLLSYEALNSNGDWYCFAYTEDQISETSWLDSSFKAARAMGIIANIALGVPMVLLLAIGCVRFNLLAIKGMGWLELLGSVTMMLTLVMLSSDLTKDPFNGTFYVGPGLAIASSIIGFLTALCILKIPKAEDPLENQPPAQAFQPGTETTTETVMPDGSKKVVKTLVNPDGSQTVTETVIPAGAS